MQIYIVRHGIAEAIAKDGSDEGRELTSEGKQRIKEEAEGFAQLEFPIDHVYSSPLLRARQTAEFFAAALNLPIEEMKELRPAGSPDSVCAHIKRLDAGTSIMLVGHEPNCSELASHLLAGRGAEVSVDFKKGAICVIETTKISRGSGTLVWHASPKILRSLR
jgi:phosphohistidine phosphatase